MQPDAMRYLFRLGFGEGVGGNAHAAYPARTRWAGE